MFDLKYTLCRICLEAVTQSNGFNIFITEDLAKKLISCTGQPVASTDKFPDQLCHKCYENVNKFYEFQQMGYKSLTKFLNLLKAAQKGEGDSFICAHHASNSLKQDEGEPGTEESSNNSHSSFKTLTKEKSNGKTENGLEDHHNVKKVVVTKRPNLSLMRKNYKSGVSKDKTKNDLKEYLQFGKEDNVKQNIGSGLISRQPLNEQNAANPVLEDSTIAKGINKEEIIEQQQIEEIILSDVQDCGSRREHQCQRCSATFKTLFKLQVHSRQHDGLPPYLCSVKGCTSSFDRWQSYKKHLKDHNAREQNFRCDMDNCERVYKNKSNLNIHKRKFHKFGPELKTHMCEICGKVFKSSAVLNDHHFTHIDKTQLPYACEEEDCSKRFSTKEKLKIHKMRHAGIKNFACPHCGMRKTTRNELKIHINYHTLERTWPCRFCPKVCNSAGNLKMHIKNIHEGAKDFACRFCQRTFAKADTKKYHEMTHTGEKPNECKECGRRFVQPAALRTHRKIHLRQREKLTDKQKSKAKMTVIEAESYIAGNIEETNLLSESMVADILNDATES